MSNAAPATIEDVARLAEVSIATVSRAIHTPDKVAKSTRQRVNQAIAITGYTTNAMARSLRMGRSNMILVLAPDIGDPNFSSILIGIENEARAHGYGVLIGHTQNDPERGLEYLKFLNSNQAAGLVLFTGHEPFGHQELAQRLPPTVAVFEPVFGTKVSYVGVDDTAGARKAAEYLLASGHRDIAFIGDSKTKLGHVGGEKGMTSRSMPPASAGAAHRHRRRGFGRGGTAGRRAIVHARHVAERLHVRQRRDCRRCHQRACGARL